MDTTDARKLGLLDLLVRNWDRVGNWQRDGGRVFGFDHAAAFVDHPEVETNPFLRHYARPVPAEYRRAFRHREPHSAA